MVSGEEDIVREAEYTLDRSSQVWHMETMKNIPANIHTYGEFRTAK